MSKSQHNHIQLAKSLADLFHPLVQVELFSTGEKRICVYNQMVEHSPSQYDDYQSTPLSNENAHIIAIKLPLDQDHSLILHHDQRQLAQFRDFLNQYLQTRPSHTEPAVGSQQIDESIAVYLNQHQLSLQSLKSQNKRHLIAHLHQKGLFRYQDATKYLAKKLNISRATVYNYLNQANQLQAIAIHQVDAFTDEPFSGNPAGVVFDAECLDETMMKKIAREMNLSETAFILESQKADIRLRYFTPTGHEVKFCGHSTVSALYMLAHEKKCHLTETGKHPMMIETLVGILSAEVNIKDNATIEVSFHTPPIELVPTSYQADKLATALDINHDIIDQRFPIMYEKTSQNLYITVNNLAKLEGLSPSIKLAKQFSKSNDIVCLCFVTPEAIDSKSHLHMRCFAPAVGIDEDPFTGSVLGGLAAYIDYTHLINTRKKRYRIEQGHFINRPGFVDISISKGNSTLNVIIHAKARHFFSTFINL